MPPICRHLWGVKGIDVDDMCVLLSSVRALFGGSFAPAIATIVFKYILLSVLSRQSLLPTLWSVIKVRFATFLSLGPQGGSWSMLQFLLTWLYYGRFALDFPRRMRTLTHAISQHVILRQTEFSSTAGPRKSDAFNI